MSKITWVGDLEVAEKDEGQNYFYIASRVVDRYGIERKFDLRLKADDFVVVVDLFCGNEIDPVATAHVFFNELPIEEDE